MYFKGEFAKFMQKYYIETILLILPSNAYEGSKILLKSISFRFDFCAVVPVVWEISTFTG